MQQRIKAAGGGREQHTELDGTVAAPSRPTQTTREGRHSSKKVRKKKKAIYLLNAPSGLFMAVDGARPRESQYPPRLPVPLQVNQSDCCTERGTYNH